MIELHDQNCQIGGALKPREGCAKVRQGAGRQRGELFLLRSYRDSHDEEAERRDNYSKRLGTVHYRVSSGGCLRGEEKCSVVRTTRTFATESARRNIRVNGIAPSFIRTPMNTAILESHEYPGPLIAREPEEIVAPAICSASNASSFWTGFILVDDDGLASGGSTAHAIPSL